MAERIVIANIPIDLFTIESLHNQIRETIINGRKAVFLHSNARLIELANTREKWMIDFFNRPQHYVLCDGSGVQIAAKLTNQKIPMKIPYNTWIWEFAKFLRDEKFSMFLLGADTNTIAAAKTNLEKHSIGINIVGASDGFFNKSKDSDENLRIIDEINRFSPDVLLVGFGMPIQETWINENYDSLNVKCIFTCGGAFDFISGNKPVAPKIFRKLYLEWLFRFMLDPMRLFGRVSISFFRFGIVIGKQVINQSGH